MSDKHLTYIVENRHNLVALDETDLANPEGVVQDFCDEHNIELLRKDVDDLFNARIIDMEFNDPDERRQLLDFRQWFHRFLEANYLLHWRRNIGVPPKKEGDAPPATNN